jgi:hypothetical protein
VHACSELGALHSNAPIPNSSIIGLESNVIAVKAMCPSHKVVAIVGHGKCFVLYSHFAGNCVLKVVASTHTTTNKLGMCTHRLC